MKKKKYKQQELLVSIQYFWIEQGKIKMGQTIVAGLDIDQARNRFFIENPHVQPLKHCK